MVLFSTMKCTTCKTCKTFKAHKQLLSRGQMISVKTDKHTIQLYTVEEISNNKG